MSNTECMEIEDFILDFHLDDYSLIDGEEEVSDRQYMAELLAEIFAGDQDGEIDKTTSEYVSLSNESRDDEVIDEIFNPNAKLTHSLWVSDDISGKLFQNDDGDRRSFTSEDLAKAEEVLSDLERELFGLPAVEDRKALLRVLRKAQHMADKYRTKYAKLDDIGSNIESRSLVSADIYDMLCDVSAGVESRLPNRHYYTATESSVNLNVTLEAIDAGKATLAAGGTAAALMLVWKIISWIRGKLGMGASKAGEATSKLADIVEDTIDSNKSAESSGDIFKSLDEMEESDLTETLREQHPDGGRITPNNVRQASASRWMAKLKDGAKSVLACLSNHSETSKLRKSCAALGKYLENDIYTAIDKKCGYINDALNANDANTRSTDGETPEYMKEKVEEFTKYINRDLGRDVDDHELADIIRTSGRNVVENAKGFKDLTDDIAKIIGGSHKHREIEKKITTTIAEAKSRMSTLNEDYRVIVAKHVHDLEILGRLALDCGRTLTDLFKNLHLSVKCMGKVEDDVKKFIEMADGKLAKHQK